MTFWFLWPIVGVIGFFGSLYIFLVVFKGVLSLGFLLTILHGFYPSCDLKKLLFYYKSQKFVLEAQNFSYKKKEFSIYGEKIFLFFQQWPFLPPQQNFNTINNNHKPSFDPSPQVLSFLSWFPLYVHITLQNVRAEGSFSQDSFVYSKVSKEKPSAESSPPPPLWLSSFFANRVKSFFHSWKKYPFSFSCENFSLHFIYGPHEIVGQHLWIQGQPKNSLFFYQKNSPKEKNFFLSIGEEKILLRNITMMLPYGHDFQHKAFVYLGLDPKKQENYLISTTFTLCPKAFSLAHSSSGNMKEGFLLFPSVYKIFQHYPHKQYPCVLYELKAQESKVVFRGKVFSSGIQGSYDEKTHCLSLDIGQKIIKLPGSASFFSKDQLSPCLSLGNFLALFPQKLLPKVHEWIYKNIEEGYFLYGHGDIFLPRGSEPWTLKGYFFLHNSLVFVLPDLKKIRGSLQGFFNKEELLLALPQGTLGKQKIFAYIFIPWSEKKYTKNWTLYGWKTDPFQERFSLNFSPILKDKYSFSTESQELQSVHKSLAHLFKTIMGKNFHSSSFDSQFLSTTFYKPLLLQPPYVLFVMGAKGPLEDILPSLLSLGSVTNFPLKNIKGEARLFAQGCVPLKKNLEPKDVDFFLHLVSEKTQGTLPLKEKSPGESYLSRVLNQFQFLSLRHHTLSFLMNNKLFIAFGKGLTQDLPSHWCFGYNMIFFSALLPQKRLFEILDYKFPSFFKSPEDLPFMGSYCLEKNPQGFSFFQQCQHFLFSLFPGTQQPKNSPSFLQDMFKISSPGLFQGLLDFSSFGLHWPEIHMVKNPQEPSWAYGYGRVTSGSTSKTPPKNKKPLPPEEVYLKPWFSLPSFFSKFTYGFGFIGPCSFLAGAQDVFALENGYPAFFGKIQSPFVQGMYKGYIKKDLTHCQHKIFLWVKDIVLPQEFFHYLKDSLKKPQNSSSILPQKQTLDSHQDGLDFSLSLQQEKNSITHEVNIFLKIDDIQSSSLLLNSCTLCLEGANYGYDPLSPLAWTWYDGYISGQTFYPSDILHNNKKSKGLWQKILHLLTHHNKKELFTKNIKGKTFYKKGWINLTIDPIDKKDIWFSRKNPENFFLFLKRLLLGQRNKNVFTPLSEKFHQRDSFSEVVLDIGHLGPLLKVLDLHVPSDLFFLWAIHIHDSRPFYEGYFSLKNVSTKNKEAKLISFLSPGIFFELFHQDCLFYRIESHFTYDYRYLDLTNGKAEAINLGFLFEGKVDTSKKNLNLQGVFIPAYFFNTLFRKIPILRYFVGGKKGFISSTFKIKGALSSPKVSLEPMSFLQLGLLKNLLEDY